MPNERNQLTRQAASPDTITDPAADWAASNWTLKAGQWGFETDTGLVKLGDGVTPWNSLGYFGGGGGRVLKWFSRYQDPGFPFPTYAQASRKVTSNTSVDATPGIETWLADGVEDDSGNSGGYKFTSESSGILTFEFVCFAAKDVTPGSFVFVVDILNSDYGANYDNYRTVTGIMPFTANWAQPQFSLSSFIDITAPGATGEIAAGCYLGVSDPNANWAPQNFELSVWFEPADGPGVLTPI